MFLTVKKIILALTAVCLMLVALEWGLKLANFAVDMPPVVFETTDSEGETDRANGYYDPELRWKFHKGRLYDRMMINSLGYRDREVDPVKVPDVIRVICMGDSVTAQGHPPYSWILNDMLVAMPPGPGRFEAFNMAVYGYSSVQGLRVFQTETVHLQPDIVTLFYGWNDHWLEMQTDRNRMAIRTGRWSGRLYNILKRRRVFMLMVNAIAGQGSMESPRDEPGFRVPPDEYVATMTDFVAAIRSAGARPLLITAPSRQLTSRAKRFPEAYAAMDFNVIHDNYVELTRMVAAQTGAELLDLHEMAAAQEYDRYFSRDGIHFEQAGLQKIAEAIYLKLVDMFGSR